MARVACPECAGSVSHQAYACPHCGHPLAAGRAEFWSRAAKLTVLLVAAGLIASVLDKEFDAGWIAWLVAILLMAWWGIYPEPAQPRAARSSPFIRLPDTAPELPPESE